MDAHQVCRVSPIRCADVAVDLLNGVLQLGIGVGGGELELSQQPVCVCVCVCAFCFCAVIEHLLFYGNRMKGNSHSI